MKKYCLDCKKKISQFAIRCRSCARKEIYRVKPKLKLISIKNLPEMKKETHWHWKGGRPKCKECGKQLANYDSIYCVKCASLGERCYNWQGGITKLPYAPEWTERLKESIRKRDNYTCQNCGLTNEEHLIVYDYDLIIHHINYDKQNCKEDNLITLCNQCNSRANFDRDYWQQIYQKKVIQLLHKVKD
jgi:hypothetical protein